MKETGSCVLYIDFCVIQSGKEIACKDPQLTSGFFAAIFTFAKVTTGVEDAIKYLPLSNLNYYFFMQDNYIFILETDKVDTKFEYEDFNSILQEIAEFFFNFVKTEHDGGDVMVMIDDEPLIDNMRGVISKYIRRSIFKK